MRMLLSLAIVLVALFVAPTAAASTPPGISVRGLVLWNFEALLHDRFGNRDVCTRDGFNFVSGSCAPLAVWQPYFFVFSAARRSAYLVTTRRPRASFGQGAGLVRISGRYITCATNHRKFVVRYFRAASFTLDCVPPLP